MTEGWRLGARGTRNKTVLIKTSEQLTSGLKVTTSVGGRWRCPSQGGRGLNIHGAHGWSSCNNSPETRTSFSLEPGLIVTTDCGLSSLTQSNSIFKRCVSKVRTHTHTSSAVPLQLAWHFRTTNFLFVLFACFNSHVFVSKCWNCLCGAFSGKSGVLTILTIP